MTGRKDIIMKIKGIKKAIGERKDWLRRGYGHIAKIMIDLESGYVWCDCFLDGNSWAEYPEESVECINDLCYEYEMPITMTGIKVAILKAMRDGLIPDIFEVGGKLPYVE